VPFCFSSGKLSFAWARILRETAQDEARRHVARYRISLACVWHGVQRIDSPGRLALALSMTLSGAIVLTPTLFIALSATSAYERTEFECPGRLTLALSVTHRDI
jgi:hypothetical protein